MKVVYMINSKCNTNCFHCYRNKKYQDKSVGECEKDIMCLLKLGHEVIVAGAEVLLNPEKIRLYKLVNQNYLLSNGILIAKNPSILEKIPSFGIKKIELSWHIGFPKLLESVPENIVLKAINNINNAGLQTAINCVINNQNYDKADEMIRRFIENRVKSVKFLQIVPCNEKAIPFLMNSYQKNIFLEKIKKLRMEIDENTLHIGLHGSFNADITKKRKELKRLGLFCLAGHDFAVIESDGNIYPCPLLTDKRFYIGFMRHGEMVIDYGNNYINHNGRNCLACKVLTCKS
jgi:MoaA/NifB/PqqE/SkfB family radical SAM enzyme